LRAISVATERTALASARRAPSSMSGSPEKCCNFCPCFVKSLADCFQSIRAEGGSIDELAGLHGRDPCSSKCSPSSTSVTGQAGLSIGVSRLKWKGRRCLALFDDGSSLTPQCAMLGHARCYSKARGVTQGVSYGFAQCMLYGFAQTSPHACHRLDGCASECRSISSPPSRPCAVPENERQSIARSSASRIARDDGLRPHCEEAGNVRCGCLDLDHDRFLDGFHAMQNTLGMVANVTGAQDVFL